MRLAAFLIAALMLAGTIIPGMADSQDTDLVLRVAMQEDMKGTNPLTVSDVWSWDVLAYIYDGPINMNPDTEELVPYVAVGTANVSGKADSWADCAIGNFGYSPRAAWEDGAIPEAVLFYDFTNVTWHDGEQMDIRDVLFSMHAAAQVPKWSGSMDPLKAANFTETGWLEVYKAWESSDGLQAALRFRQREPFAEFFKSTLSTFLLPEHIWACTISGQAVDHAKIWCDAGYSPDAADAWKVAPATQYENNPPIGSGPFKFETREKGQFIKVSTFRDHFWSEDYRYVDYVGEDEYSRTYARQPYIDAITYKIFKTAEAAVLALKQNDIDYIAWSIPPTFTQELANEAGISMRQTPEPGFFYLGYNMRKSSLGYAENGTDIGKPLRQAIAHCINKDLIVRRLLLNLGIAADGPVSSLSEWYNASIPKYDFDPEKAKQILADAGYKVKDYYSGVLYTGENATAMAGDPNWWYNPDGSPIGHSTGGMIEIITPEANYDPTCGQTGGLQIAQQLRDMGIYAQSVAMDFGSIVDRIDQRDFDMYVLGWSIGSDPSDYLHAFFYSDQADTGQNYPGYNNSTFDSLIDLARQTDDPEVKKKAIFDAQAAICYDLPYDVLYYRTNIEAYRSDRFIGWEVDNKGSIFSLESLYNIHSPGLWKAIAMFVSPPSAVVSNSTTPLTIYVKDQDGNPISGARVLLNATAGKLSQETVDTSANGQATVMFTAPYADPLDHDAVQNGTNVVISIEAATYVTDDGTVYDPAPSRLTVVRVFPEGAEFLSITMTADPDVISDNTNPILDREVTPGFTYVDVTVTDQDGDPVSGSPVALTASPDVPIIEPADQLTDADGKARFKVTSIDLPDNDSSEVQYTLRAIAIHPTDTIITGENSMSITVIDATILDDPTPPTEFPAFETVVIITGVVVTALAFAIFRRRGRQ